MIFRRVLTALVAAAMFAAAAAVVVVALAFALYALVEPQIGRSGASAVVAGAFAVLIGLGGFFVAMSGRPPRIKPSAAATAAEEGDENARSPIQIRPSRTVARTTRPL